MHDKNHNAFMTFNEIDSAGRKTFTGKYTLSAEDHEKLTNLAKQSYSAMSDANRLRDDNRRLANQIWSLESAVYRLKKASSELKEKCKPYLEALKFAPQAVKEFLDGILEKFKNQKKDIMYKPNPTQQRTRNRDYER